MADWWVGGGGDGILMVAALPLLLGALIGLLAGSVPARRASRIEPIAALRGT